MSITERLKDLKLAQLFTKSHNSMGDRVFRMSITHGSFAFTNDSHLRETSGLQKCAPLWPIEFLSVETIGGV
jgi:hypothetical protein